MIFGGFTHRPAPGEIHISPHLLIQVVVIGDDETALASIGNFTGDGAEGANVTDCANFLPLIGSSQGLRGVFQNP